MEESTKEPQKIYELAFLANPSLPEEKLLGLIEKIKSWAKDLGCEIIKEASPQKRKLGYAIKKLSSAFLVSLIIRGPATVPETLGKKMSVEEKILRHLFVAYSQKELDQLGQRSRAVRIKEVMPLSTQAIPQSALSKESAKEEMMDKKSLKELDKRLEEILGKSL